MTGQSKPSTQGHGSPGGRKPTNPYKKRSPGERNSSKMNKTVQYILKGWGFGPESTFEIYNYSSGSPTLGWKDGYTLYLRQFVDGTHEVDELVAAGITGYYFMRVRRLDNESARGTDNWPRFNILRMLPNGAYSTRESIQQGQSALRVFFMNDNYSLYPPAAITCIDATNYESPTPLDHFLLDADVMAVMNLIFDHTILTPTFVRTYPALAGMFFSGPVYSQLAVETLGYGSTQPVGHAAGFHLPEAERQNNTSETYQAEAAAFVAEIENESSIRAGEEGKQESSDGEDSSTEVEETATPKKAAGKQTRSTRKTG